MKYPITLHSKLEEIRAITSNWHVDVNFDHVIKWILQFDPPDHKMALAVLQNLNVIGQTELNNALSVAYSKLMRKAIERDARISGRNTLFAGVGPDGKSGAMMSYHFRLINEISEENFLSKETMKHLGSGRIDNIVLVDDVLASGRQVSKEIKTLSEKVTPLGVKNIFVLTACGFRTGIELVERETKAHTFAAYEYEFEDTAASFDSSFYQGISHGEKETMRRRLEDYGKICHKAPLGFAGIGAFIVFYYNTPNCTLPIIWSSQNSWIPLFRRATRINGITAYYRQFDKAIGSKTQTQTEVEKNPLTTEIHAERQKKPQEFALTLLVEGKFDEIFFDYLSKRRDLAKMIDVKKITVIALGGPYGSPKLMKLVAETSFPAILVIDGDRHNRQILENKPENFHGIPCVFLRPTIFGLVNLIDVYLDEEFGETLPPLPPEPIAPTDETYSEVERELLKRGSMAKAQARLRKIVDSFIDEAALAIFVNELHVKLDELLATRKQ